MVIREIAQFAEIRYKARAYMCYLLSRNIPNRLPEPNINSAALGLEKIMDEVDGLEALYILDYKGEQIVDNITKNELFKGGKGNDRSHKSYYYRAIREGRCVLTDPYPSSLTNELSVTAAAPIFNDKQEVVFVACIDISLQNILNLSHPASFDSMFGRFTSFIYAMFSLALLIVALALFIQGVESFFLRGISFERMDVKEMFESTIILTLALAIFDLVKTIFEEEVLGRNQINSGTNIHKTMVRFLGSIVIALAIEALMLVFKFSITGPENIIYAVYLLGGVTMLLIGLSVYLKAMKSRGFDDSYS